MSAIARLNFGNRTFHYVKRHLSVHEKSSLPTLQGRALILPGAPNTEVEELVDVGWDPCYIFGVESDPEVFSYLVNHYWDGTHIYHADVLEWMSQSRARGQYSYIHLDFCGHLQEDLLVGVQAWKDLVAPLARVRVTTSYARRMPNQQHDEAYHHRGILQRLCEVGKDLDVVDPDRWDRFIWTFRESQSDNTQVLTGLALLNFFFGAELLEWYDACLRQGNGELPEVRGHRVITGVTRYTYHEMNRPNYMATVWIDLAPLPNAALPMSSQWVLNEVARVMDMIITPIAPYVAG